MTDRGSGELELTTLSGRQVPFPSGRSGQPQVQSGLRIPSSEEGLMVCKRRRKKLPVPELQPLARPTQPDEMWGMDCVFDELTPEQAFTESIRWFIHACEREAPHALRTSTI